MRTPRPELLARCREVNNGSIRPAARIAVVLAFLFPSTDCVGQGADLKSELIQRSERDGLAIVNAATSYVTVMPLGSPLTDLQNPRGNMPGWFTPDGKHVVWHQLEYLALETFDEKRLGTLEGRFRLFRALAVSPDLTKVAFEVTSGAGTRRISGLHWGTLGSTELNVIASEPQANESYKASCSLGWSSDSTRIVYERDNKIRVYDIRTGGTANLGEGVCPTWSPSGDWIAYRSLESEAMLMTPNGDARTRLMPGRKILGFLHWSPDSAYLLFSEEVRWNPLNASQLVVLRVRDRETTPVMDFGPEGGQDKNFSWIYDYKSFCATCNRTNGRPR